MVRNYPVVASRITLTL